MDKTAFLNGISTKANELFLTREIRDEILKLAGLFKHDDNLQMFIDQGVLRDGNNDGTVEAIAKHMAEPALVAGAGGAAIGGGIGRLFTKNKEDKGKNTSKGAIAGGLLGVLGGGYNDFRQLVENQDTLREAVNSSK